MLEVEFERVLVEDNESRRKLKFNLMSFIGSRFGFKSSH